MSVKKIFVTLIIIVACVMLGALVLNVLFPNVAKTVVNATEDMLYNATGMKFDFNNDGVVGGVGSTGQYVGDQSAGGAEGANGGNVEGFQ